MPLPSHEELERAVVEGDIEEARRLAESLVRARADLLAAIEHGFGAGIRKVGTVENNTLYGLTCGGLQDHLYTRNVMRGNPSGPVDPAGCEFSTDAGDNMY